MRGVAVLRSRREYHTRAGWWFMTHEGALIAVISAVSCAVLVADSLYVASRWTGLGSTFNFGFAGGAVGLLLVGLLAKTLHLDDQARMQRGNLLMFVVVTVLLIASDMFGVGLAPLLGGLAALAAIFPGLLVLSAGMRRAARRN
jgi:hypothetical protein